MKNEGDTGTIKNGCFAAIAFDMCVCVLCTLKHSAVRLSESSTLTTLLLFSALCLIMKWINYQLTQAEICAHDVCECVCVCERTLYTDTHVSLWVERYVRAHMMCVFIASIRCDTSKWLVLSKPFQCATLLVRSLYLSLFLPLPCYATSPILFSYFDAKTM